MSVTGQSLESTHLFGNHGGQQYCGFCGTRHNNARTHQAQYGATPFAPNGRGQLGQPVPGDLERGKFCVVCGNLFDIPRDRGKTDMYRKIFVILLVAYIVVHIIVTIFIPWLNSVRQDSPPQAKFPVRMLPGEIGKYRSLGISWGPAQPLECGNQYGHRKYYAQFDNMYMLFSDLEMIKACEAIPIEIGNHTLEAPDLCEKQDAQMYGYWTVYDPLECTIEDEIQKYRNSGMHWATPQPAEHCHTYGKREFEAHLEEIPDGYDWNKACNYMRPLRIEGQVVEKPDSCEHRGNGEYGKWMLSNQSDCKPYWGPLKDLGCQASRKQRHEAPLWNLIEGDNWYGMCASTPATWYGRFYAHTMACDYRHNRGGTIGIWEGEDCS